MKRRAGVGAIVALAAAIALSGVVLAAGAFANGDFEPGDWAPNSMGFETLYAGTASAGAITDWTVTGGSVDWIGKYWQAPNGTMMSVDMNGTDAAGTIAQTFATTPNSTYLVKFWLAGNPDGGPATKNLIVHASSANAPQATYSFTNDSSTTRSAMGWVEKTYSFVASSDTTTLTFQADPNNSSSFGPVLGDVAVTYTAATGADCKDGGWQKMFESNGSPFKNQGACVSFYATGGATPIGQ